MSEAERRRRLRAQRDERDRRIRALQQAEGRTTARLPRPSGAAGRLPTKSHTLDKRSAYNRRRLAYAQATG